MRPWRAADHSPPSSAAVMEEYSYTSTHPLGHTGPVTGSLYLFTFIVIFKEWDGEAWTELFWLRIGTGGGLFGCGNELPCSIKCWKFIDYLRNCLLLRKYSALLC